MKIIFIRHGQDDDRYRGGWSNTCLTDEGIFQVNDLAEHFNKHKVYLNISHIVTSDLKRTKMTAEIISATTGLEVKTDSALREINNGVLAGMPNSEAERQYPNLYFSALGFDEKYPNGESPCEFFTRIKTWFEGFIDEHKSDSKNIVAVTHFGVINIVYHIVNGIEWSNKNKPFRITPCSMHILDVDKMEIEELRCKNENY